MPYGDDVAVGAGDPVVGGTLPTVHQAKDIGDAIIAGLQSSSMGLALRGKLPSMQLGEDAPWYQRAAAGAGGIVGDAPLIVGGAMAGAAAGSAVPVVGTAVGGGAGALAVPMAVRQGLIAAYENNHASSWQGVWDIAKAALVGGAKGAAIGGATMGAGRIVTPLVAPLAGRAVLAGDMSAQAARYAVDTTAFGTELATMTTAAAGLEGHLPTAKDFMDNAILLGGVKGAVAIAKGMRSTYAETGRTPDQIAADAKADPTIAAQLERGTLEIPDAYKPLALEERIKAAIDADPKPEAMRKMLMNDGSPTKLGEPPINDPVKPEYITDQDTLKGVIRAVEQLYEPEIQAQTRGQVTNKATAAAALESIASGDAVEHAIGSAENATQLYARAHVLKAVLQEAYTNMAKLQGVPEAELTPSMKLAALASNEKVSMVYSEFRGARAEAGRALQIFQALKRDNSVIGDAETLIKLAERKGPLQNINLDSFKDTTQLAKFIEGYNAATTTEKVLEAWKAAILTGPQTHLANIMGNLMKWGVETPENVIAAAISAGKRAIAGDPMTMAEWKARAFAPVYGLQFGAKDAVTIAGEVWRQEGMHLEKIDVQRGAIPGKLGEFVRLPFKALQSEDALFRTVAERAEAHIMAVDRVVKEGFNPDTLEGKGKIAEYTNDPTAGLEEEAGLAATKRVQQAGAEGVFSERLGPRLEQVQRAMVGHWSQFVIPFFRTPANLVSWAVQHVPGLNLLSGRWRDDYAAGGDRQARALSRVIVGAGLTLTAYEMASNGSLTGGGLFNKEESGSRIAAGWQPYSVKIGDKYYSYQRIEPLAKVLGIAADTFDMMNNSKVGDDWKKLVPMAVLMFGNATISTTYLSGLANVIQSLSDPERYGENFLEQYASSIVPKAIGQAVAMHDPYKREVDTIGDAIQSQLPFIREKLMPKRDVWGEPVRNDKWFDIMPVQVSEASQNKVATEAMRLHLAIADAPKFVMERAPFAAKEKRTELEPEQRDILREVRGKNAMAILAPIVNAEDWKQIPDFAKAEIYRKVLEGTTKQGVYAALPPDAAARQKLRDQLVGKILQQVQDAEGK